MATNVPKLKGAKAAGSKPSGGGGVVAQGQGVDNLSRGVAKTLKIPGAVAGGGTTVNSQPTG